MKTYFYNIKSDKWNFKYFPLYITLFMLINLFFTGTGPLIERVSIFRLFFLIILFFISTYFYAWVYSTAKKYSNNTNDLPHKVEYISYTKRAFFLTLGIISLLLSMIETIWNFVPFEYGLHFFAIAIFITIGTLLLMSSFYYSVDKTAEKDLTIDGEKDQKIETIGKSIHIGKRKIVIVTFFLLGISIIIISGLIQLFHNNKIDGVVQIIAAILVVFYMWLMRKKFIN